MQQFNFTALKCSQCQKEIIPIFDIYVEFNKYFYHKECFKCRTCNDEFDIGQVSHLPILDNLGRLYCKADFIRTLACGICLSNFDLNSQITKLRKDEEKNILAHVECIKCEFCNKNLQVSNEYLLVKDENIFKVNCKGCVLDQMKESKQKLKCIKSVNHRLSSRQKELLAKKIISDNIDVDKIMLSNESFELFLETLSVFIKCSKKSLANYLNKHLNKSKQVKIHNDNKETLSIKTMLNDLKKLDKIIAPPNQCPFSAKVRSNSVLNNITSSVCN